jgi:hypothetical protein
VWAALLRKEWCEQRWRFFLATVVLSGLLAGLLRAQVIPSYEAATLLYGPVGLVLVIFYAAAPVSSERADRTWEFLTIQPVSRAEVILTKWMTGASLLAGTMVISTVAGLVAMWSRGIRMMPQVYLAWSGGIRMMPDQYQGIGQYSPDQLATWSTTHPALALCVFGAAATITMICWFTPLYLLLARARNEFAATLGGVFLTIAASLWLAQILIQIEPITHGGYMGITRVKIVVDMVAGIAMAILNPLSPLNLVLASINAVWLPLALFISVSVWVVLPLWWACRNSGRIIGKWVGA